MKIIKTRKTEINFIKATLAAFFCLLLYTPFSGEQMGAQNSFSKVYLDGNYIGCVSDPSKVESLLLEARLQLAKEEKQMIIADVDCTFEPLDSVIGKSLTEKQLYQKLYDYMKNDTVDIQQAYLLKINTYTAYLDDIEDVYEVLEKAKEKYDPENRFQVNIVADTEREINMYTAELVSSGMKQEEAALVGAKISDLELYEDSFGYQDILEEAIPSVQDTFGESLTESLEEPKTEPAEEPETDEEIGEDGLKALSFAEKVEISEAYVSKDLILSAEEAAEQVTKDQAKNEVYEVQPGDTLSVIANSHDLYIKDVLALNEGLDENTTLHVGDELIITVPQPELTVRTVEQATYEESYEAEVEYIYNDSWYTTESVTRQESEEGYHKVTALISKVNGREESREIIQEEVLQAPVPKIVEIGTVTPPTYIKPISGGRLSSRFGGRNAPVKGASTNHKGVDWATPVGTAVMASSGGTVATAGWQNGYGYVIYINHPDGKQTRYAHLSKVLVSPGQTVKQGQKIALSGNTGRSSGPHVHFEIRVNGKAVNPLDYL